MLECHLPHPPIAAIAVRAVADSNEPYAKSMIGDDCPEPYRRAAYVLG